MHEQKEILYLFSARIEARERSELGKAAAAATTNEQTNIELQKRGQLNTLQTTQSIQA